MACICDSVWQSVAPPPPCPVHGPRLWLTDGVQAFGSHSVRATNGTESASGVADPLWRVDDFDQAIARSDRRGPRIAKRDRMVRFTTFPAMRDWLLDLRDGWPRRFHVLRWWR